MNLERQEKKKRNNVILQQWYKCLTSSRNLESHPVSP